MGLQVLWSFGLLCLDIHALRFNKDLHTNIIVSLFVVGDWVTNTSLNLHFLQLLLPLHRLVPAYNCNTRKPVLSLDGLKILYTIGQK